MTTLKQLLEENKITQDQYDIYMIFVATDAGKRFLARKKEDLFKAIVKDMNSHASLAFLEGTKNVFQDIQFNIDHVEKLMQEK